MKLTDEQLSTLRNALTAAVQRFASNINTLGGHSGDARGLIRQFEKQIEETTELTKLFTTFDDVRLADSEDAAKSTEKIARAREEWASDDLEIDDEPTVSIADDGTWVSAWVWVPNKEEELS